MAVARIKRSLEYVVLLTLIEEMPTVPPITFVKLEGYDRQEGIPWNTFTHSTTIRNIQGAERLTESVVERGTRKLGVIAVIRAPVYVRKDEVEVIASYSFAPNNGKMIKITLKKRAFGWNVILRDVERTY